MAGIALMSIGHRQRALGRSREVGNEVLVLSDLNVEVRAVRRVAAVSERSGAKLQAAEVFGRSSTAASPAVPCILYLE